MKEDNLAKNILMQIKNKNTDFWSFSAKKIFCKI